MNGYDLAARDLDLLANIGVTVEQAADALRAIARHALDPDDYAAIAAALGLAEP